MTLLANINIGSAPNDGTGDSLRESFIKCNDNFQILDTLATEFQSGNLNTNISSTGTSNFNTVNITGNVISSANITASYFIGDGSALTGILASDANTAVYAENIVGNLQPNITEVGPLTGLTVIGTVVTDTVESATIGNIGANLVGTMQTAIQPVITSLGALTGLDFANSAIVSNVFCTVYRTDNVYGASGATANVRFWTNNSMFNSLAITSNLSILYPGTIQSGIQKMLSIQNTSGSTVYVSLPNSTNNKGANVFPINAGITATVTFFSYDDTSANVTSVIVND